MTENYRLHRDAALRTGQARKPRSGPVATLRVAAVVMAEALRLAGGDARRLEIRSPQTVVVLNNPRGA